MTALLPPRTEVDDADLVARAREGDRTAFDELYGRHADRVTAVCRSRVSASDTDDVVQDAFIKAWERLDQLAEPAAFGAWIRAIAARLCIDLHRGSGRTVATGTIDDHAVVRDGSDHELLRRETADLVHSQMAVLNDRDREALFLRDGLDASITELADRFDLSEGSTRVMLSRARTRLRSAWAAVLAWFVGLRALRHLGGSTPQMVAATVAIASVPLLVLPAITGTGPFDTTRPSDVKVEGVPAAPTLTTTRPATVVESPAAVDTDAATTTSPVRPSPRVTPAAPVAEAPAEEDSQVILETGGVGEGGEGLTVEKQASEEDTGAAADGEIQTGEDESDFQVFVGNVNEFVDETVSGGDDDSDGDSGGDEERQGTCILHCD